ncbi:MAG: TraB/GumN family protein [Pseudomonadota bacterium]
MDQAAEIEIVTGSSGFIGLTLVKKRLAQRYRVLGFDRKVPPHRPPGAECICIDLTDPPNIEAAVEPGPNPQLHPVHHKFQRIGGGALESSEIGHRSRPSWQRMNRPRGRLPRRVIALAWALAVLPLAAHAQEQQNWGAPEIVEVQARPGPAVWHLTRGDSEVWILGTVSGIPSGLEWNKDYLAELLDGARAILMPPRPSIGLFEGAWFLLTNGSKLSLPRGQALDAVLPAELDVRFAATRERLGQNQGHYRTDTPLRAALRLEDDVQVKLNLTRDEPSDTIRKLARDKRVPLAPIARYEVADAAKDMLKLPPAEQQICLSESVEDANWELSHAALAAQAWAVGDLTALKANYGEARLAHCVIAAVQSVADISERDVADYTAAINDALSKPGKTIAVIEIGPLLRKNGVLQRLEALHVTIEGPAEQSR